MALHMGEREIGWTTGSKIRDDCGMRRPPKPNMTKYENQKLEKVTFVAEECYFINCALIDCDLFFSGGEVEWSIRGLIIAAGIGAVRLGRLSAC